MPKGFTQHEKKLINERLLEQGNKQFSAFGLKKTNVEELARAAGISKGAFYLFYNSERDPVHAGGRAGGKAFSPGCSGRN